LGEFRKSIANPWGLGLVAPTPSLDECAPCSNMALIESRVIGLTSAVTRFAPKGHDRIAQGEALGPKERKMASPVRARQSECAWLENGSGAPSGLMAD